MHEGSVGDGKKPLRIDEGIPGGRDQWPSDVLDSLKKFAQGFLVANPPFFYFADMRRPVWKVTRDSDSDDVGVILVDEEDEPHYGLIVSQTCDIVEEEGRPKRPWVQIVPVEDRSDLTSGLQRRYRNGNCPLYSIHIPDLPGGFWVADLRMEFAVEKGWLASQKPVVGFLDDEQRRQVGYKVGRLRQRPAFSKSFVEAVQRPLVDDLKGLEDASPGLYERLCIQVDELTVKMDNHLEPKNSQISLLVRGEMDDDVLAWWNSWWDGARERSAKAGIVLHAFEVRSTDEVSLSEYRTMTVLSLGNLSPE